MWYSCFLFSEMFKIWFCGGSRDDACSWNYNQLDHVTYGLNIWCCSQDTCQRRGIRLLSLSVAALALWNLVGNWLLLLALYQMKLTKVFFIALHSHQEHYNSSLSDVFWTFRLSFSSLSQLFLYICASLLELMPNQSNFSKICSKTQDRWNVCSFSQKYLLFKNSKPDSSKIAVGMGESY